MSRIRSLIREIHRRSLWQVLGLYLLGAWAAYQVIIDIMEGFGLPGWVAPFALVLFLIGLPIVLATAFVQEGIAPPSQQPDASGSGAEVESAGPIDAREGRGLRRLFTWRKALAGGVLAFAALGLAITGFMGMRALGIGPAATLLTAGVLDARDPIVLADFENATADPSLGVTVTEALRVDLERSDVLRLVTPDRLRDALARVEGDPGAPVTAARAREIARRDGYKAWIEGAVHPAGDGYVLNARVTAAANGEVLASFRESAADADDIIPAIDRLSEAIRAEVGESLRVLRAEKPLPEVTTRSLEALRLWTEGQRIWHDPQGGQLDALPLFKAALAVDSTFAIAWSSISSVLGNLGIEPELRRHAATMAYEHRHRLSATERLFVEAKYHSYVTERRDARIDAYEALLARDSGSVIASFAAANLGEAYGERGKWDEAAKLTRRAIAIADDLDGPGRPLMYQNLIILLVNAGRISEGRAALDTMLARYPDYPQSHRWLVFWTGSAPDFVAVDSLAREHLDRFGERGRGDALNALAQSAAARGHLRAAESLFSDLELSQADESYPGRALESAAWAALVAGVATSRLDRAAARLDSAAARYDLASLELEEASYPWLAYVYARLRRPDRARSLLEEWRRRTPQAGLGRVPRKQAAEAAALIAIARLDAREADASEALSAAAAALDTVARTDLCDICWLPTLGILREREGRTEEAISAYRSYLESDWPWPLLQPIHPAESGVNLSPSAQSRDTWYRAFVLERLALLLEQTGEPREAARYYAQFIELWQDADPELQPRVEAARRALERLTNQNGG